MLVNMASYCPLLYQEARVPFLLAGINFTPSK